MSAGEHASLIPAISPPELYFCVRCFVYLHCKTKRNNEAVESLTKVYELEQAHRAVFGCCTDNIYAIILIQDTQATDVRKTNYLVLLDDAQTPHSRLLMFPLSILMEMDSLVNGK